MDYLTYTAFVGSKRIAGGAQHAMLRDVKLHSDANPASETLLIFEDQTGKQVDFDLRGSIEETLARVTPKPGPGRPKLGVTSREVSLLPRHWEWLERQPNGSSAALRRLVEEARQKNDGESEKRRAIDATGRFMTAMAGNLPGFEEAYRALYARDQEKLEKFIQVWPEDIRSYIQNQTEIPKLP